MQQTYEQAILTNEETRRQAANIMAAFECEGVLDLEEIDFLEGETEQ